MIQSPRSQNLHIRNIESGDINSVQKFTDSWIGLGYYCVEDLESILLQSHKNEGNASYLALDQNEIVGIRLSLAPSLWISKAQFPYRSDLWASRWQIPSDKVAYHKSLFIHDKYRSLGLGPRLTELAEQTLIKQGALAVVTHSWLESPENSSQRYLIKSGFIEVDRHPRFWEPIDYLCTRCQPHRCSCTALEMIKIFKK